jgi:hypothetical protein
MNRLPIHLKLINLFRKDLDLSESQAQEMVLVIDEAIHEQDVQKHQQTLELVRKDISTFKEQLDAKIEIGIKDFQSFKESVDIKFAQVDERFVQVDARFAQVDARFDKIDARFDALDEKFITKGEFYKVMSDHKSDIFKWMFGIWITIMGSIIAIILKK